MIRLNASNDQATGTIFGLNQKSQLTTMNGKLIAEKNSEDEYPFLFLDETVTGSNAPVCSTCNDALTCSYPDARAATASSAWELPVALVLMAPVALIVSRSNWGSLPSTRTLALLDRCC